MKNDPAITTVDSRELTIIRIVCLAWLAAKLISWKLWISYRLFPIIPVFDFVPEFPDYLHFILFGLSLAGIFAVLLMPQKKSFVLAVIAIEIVLCFIDQMRWQPWEYQYLLTFIFYFFYFRNPRKFLELLVFMIVATYIFSGLHKFSQSFLVNIWGKMMLKNFFGFSADFRANPIVHYAGLLLALVELLIGIGLLFLKEKKILIYGVMVMHGSLLLILGPLGINTNTVVWPWNILMIVIVWQLFYQNPIIIGKSFFKPVFNLLVIVLIGILPIFNFFGLWNGYLSFDLYSGNNEKIFICTEDANANPQLNEYLTRNDVSSYCSEKSVSVNITKWSFYELNVPPYRSERTYQIFHREFLKKFPDAKSTMVVYRFPYAENDIREIR